MADHELIKTAVEQYGNFIYRLSMHYVHNAADAEDVVQEVLLSFLTHDISDKSKIRGWLAKVTVNKSLNLLKKRNKIATKPPDLANSCSYEDGDRTISEEMKNLSPTDREIVYLYYYAGYTSDEIGKMLKKTGASVRKRLERAKKRLKDYLEEKDD